MTTHFKEGVQNRSTKHIKGVLYIFFPFNFEAHSLAFLLHSVQTLGMPSNLESEMLQSFVFVEESVGTQTENFMQLFLSCSA